MRRLQVAVKRAAKDDRRKWLEDLVGEGDWRQVRQLHEGLAPKPSKLRDKDGRAVERGARAETLAEYFERVQWAVRPMSGRQDGDERPC